MKARTKKIFTIMGGGLVLYAAVSILLFRFLNVGSLALLALGAAVLLYLRFYGALPLRARGVCNALWALAAALMVLLSSLMAYAAYGNRPDADHPAQTVIVLGAKIQEDRPSTILVHRLTKALDYLNQHPSARVVVSGGMGADEEYPESQVMRAWLEDRGIAPERILEESSSTNTGENLRFSANLIRTNGWSQEVAVCTDGFHQLRAQLLAREAGLSATGISSPTPLGLIPMYYVREWFGLVKAVVFRA